MDVEDIALDATATATVTTKAHSNADGSERHGAVLIGCNRCRRRLRCGSPVNHVNGILEFDDDDDDGEGDDGDDDGGADDDGDEADGADDVDDTAKFV